jgi:hypothetical protein
VIQAFSAYVLLVVGGVLLLSRQRWRHYAREK